MIKHWKLIQIIKVLGIAKDLHYNLGKSEKAIEW